MYLTLVTLFFLVFPPPPPAASFSRCGVEADHRPLICKYVKLWEKKCADDSETSNWLMANTKEMYKVCFNDREEWWMQVSKC